MAPFLQTGLSDVLSELRRDFSVTFNAYRVGWSGAGSGPVSFIGNGRRGVNTVLVQLEPAEGDPWVCAIPGPGLTVLGALSALATARS